MNRIEMFNLIDQLYAESNNAVDNIDESELSDELTSEGATTPNTVREAISDESMQNSPMAKSGNKLKLRSWNNVNKAKEINYWEQLAGKYTRFGTTFLKRESLLEQESSLLRLDTVPTVKRTSVPENRGSLKSDISSLLKQMVKNRQEKEMTVAPGTRKGSHTIEDFVTMKQINLVGGNWFSNLDVCKF